MFGEVKPIEGQALVEIGRHGSKAVVISYGLLHGMEHKMERESPDETQRGLPIQRGL